MERVSDCSRANMYVARIYHFQTVFIFQLPNVSKLTNGWFLRQNLSMGVMNRIELGIWRAQDEFSQPQLSSESNFDTMSVATSSHICIDRASSRPFGAKAA